MVTLGIGRWYLDGPLLLPDNVVLKGAGMDRTAIYFAFRSASNTPGTMIGAVHGSRPGDMMYPRVRYGVEDLAVYVVSHFNSIIDISPFTDGVRVQRIRIRANMCAPHGIAAAATFPEDVETILILSRPCCAQVLRCRLVGLRLAPGRRRWRAGLALDVKVILTPPCTFH